MQSVFDQLSWDTDTDAESILQLVSAQLDAQEVLRERVRDQLAKDYPSSALAWISTVTWSSPKLVPLGSYDLSKIEESAESADLHYPLVSLRIPGSRYLTPLNAYPEIGYRAKIRCPVLTWVGKAFSINGPWDRMRKLEFVSVQDQLDLTDPIPDSEYQELLVKRRQARNQFTSGDPRRIAAERAVRQARKTRNLSGVESADKELVETVTSQLELTEHTVLLSERRRAQEKFPIGHPDRVKAERAVRSSRSAKRHVSACFD